MAMLPLANLVWAKQILFGTDLPFRTAADLVESLAACAFDAQDLALIHRDNALHLMPKLMASPMLSQI